MSQRSYNLFIFAAVMLTAVGAAVGGVLAIVYDPIWLTLTLVCGTAALAFLVELVISLVRSRGKGKKKGEAAPAQGEDAVYISSDEETPSPAWNYGESAEGVQPYVYTPSNTYYTGPEDEFLSSLPPDEKREFALVFIALSRGELPRGIPAYVVGGDNKAFFSLAVANMPVLRTRVTPALARAIRDHYNANHS